MQTWTDVGSAGQDLDEGPEADGPTYSATACPNSTPAAVFATSEHLESTAVNCQDSQHRCTVVIIGRWTNTASGNEYILAGEAAGERAEIYSSSVPQYKLYAGANVTDSDTAPDTNFHAFMLDLNGLVDADCTDVDVPADCCTGSGTGTCNSAGNTPWTVDTDTDTVDAGTGTLSSGLTIGASQFGSSGFPDFEYCAIGLYEGDATADGNWSNLQGYICNTWGLDLVDACP